MSAHALHLGIEVVEIMQHQGFGKHGQLGRTELVFPMMADNEVLNKNLEFLGKAGQLGKLGFEDFQFDDHVPEQLAACRVGEGAIIGELVNLADIVQKSAGKQQVTIDLRIVLAHQVAGTEKRDHVIEQSADISMVQSLGGGSIAVGFGNVGVSHEGFDQRPEMGVLKRSDEGCQGLPEFADVFGGFWQVVREVNLRLSQTAKFVNGDLEPVLIFVEQALDLEEIVLLEGVDGVLDVIPHLGFNLAGTITEGQRKVGFSGLLRFDLFGNNHKTR